MDTWYREYGRERRTHGTRSMGWRGGHIVQVCVVQSAVSLRRARTCGRVRVRVCAGASLCVRTWVHSVAGGTLCVRGHVPVVAVWQESVVECAPRRKRGRARSDEGVHSRAHTHTRPPLERGCILCLVVVACLGYVDDAGGGVVFWARPVLVMTGDGGCLHEGTHGAYRRVSGEGKLE